VESNSPSVTFSGSRSRRRRVRRFTTGRLVWGSLLRVMQRITHYKHGDRLEFKINFSARDLLTDKRRAVKDQVEALVQAVQKAGSYQAREEATRAVHAVMDGLKGRVPADVMTKLGESSPVREVARLGRAASQRLQRDGDKTDMNVVATLADTTSETAGETTSDTTSETAGETTLS
jgi:hypothetical protein